MDFDRSPRAGRRIAIVRFTQSLFIHSALRDKVPGLVCVSCPVRVNFTPGDPRFTLTREMFSFEGLID